MLILVITFIDTPFNPEKEFEDIIAQHEAKKLENLKIKETEDDEIKVDFSNETLASYKIINNFYKYYFNSIIFDWE